MSACEKCWTEAGILARLQGRMVAEVYPEVLAANDGNPDHAEATHALIESAYARPYCSCGMWTWVPDRDHPASPEAAFEAHVGGAE